VRKVEMIRCYVTSPNDGSKTIRYIPFDIFQLWKYLMESHRNFEVTTEQASVWMDEESYSRDAPSLPPHHAEKVMEVSFLYFAESDVGRRVVRYFPLEDYETIMGYFMKNFSQEHIQESKKEVPGVFIHQSES